MDETPLICPLCDQQVTANPPRPHRALPALSALLVFAVPALWAAGAITADPMWAWLSAPAALGAFLVFCAAFAIGAKEARP